jgi:stage V sporulation protein B
MTGLLSVTRLIDVAVIPARLQSLGMSFREATALYGQLAGGALPLVTLPAVLTSALQVSLVPAITGAQANRDVPQIRKLIGAALKVSVTLMLPAAAGLRVLPAEIPGLLYRDPGLAPVLRVMACVPLLLSLEQLTSGGLQGLGRFGSVMRNHLLGAGVQAVVTYNLTGLPTFGIVGAAYGMVAGMVVCAGLNFVSLVFGVPGLLRDAVGMLPRPAIAAALMAWAVRHCYEVIVAATGLQSAAVIASAGLGAVLYFSVVGCLDSLTGLRRG